MGDIIGDLNSRRGVIQGMTDKNNAKIIDAKFHYQKCLDMQLI
jgi:elongation factor G